MRPPPPFADASVRLIQENPHPFVPGHFDDASFLGVYAIWYGHRCLYVGKADPGTVANRLWSHFLRSHNQHLRLWIRVKNGGLRFTSCDVHKRLPKSSADTDLIGSVEHYLIHALKAETNIRD